MLTLLALLATAVEPDTSDTDPVVWVGAQQLMTFDAGSVSSMVSGGVELCARPRLSVEFSASICPFRVDREGTRPTSEFVLVRDPPFQTVPVNRLAGVLNLRVAEGRSSSATAPPHTWFDLSAGVGRLATQDRLASIDCGNRDGEPCTLVARQSHLVPVLGASAVFAPGPRLRLRIAAEWMTWVETYGGIDVRVANSASLALHAGWSPSVLDRLGPTETNADR